MEKEKIEQVEETKKEKTSLFKKIFKRDSKKDIIEKAKKEAEEKALREDAVIKNDFQKNIQFDDEAYVSLRHIDKIYDNKVQAVFDFNLDIAKHEFIVLVGPSGCGKSTTLRMIAGLEEISGGELYIDHVLSNDLAPKNRNIAMVFQSYALYPHMTVYDNLAFGLKMTHVPKDEIAERVLNTAKILELEDLLDRKPRALSGGQRQRVALGRAIVRNQKVFLMDEPLSNLDAKLRVGMRNEISKLHRELNNTTIYVTHDQVEAMTMADRIVVMKDGIIQQIGTPMDLYDNPGNKFVAGFIGSPQMNFFEVELKGNILKFADGNKINIPEGILKQLNGREGKMYMGIRGEDIKLDNLNLNLYEENILKSKIEHEEIMGNENNLYFKLGGITAVARASKEDLKRVGEEFSFVINVNKMHFFDMETEENIMY